MRTTLLASLPCILLGLASCSSAIQEGSATDGSTGTDSDSESGTAGTTGTSASASASGSASESASGSGGACVPGMSVACACPDGGAGAQVCNPDGNSLGPCECAGSTSASTTDPTDGTSDGTDSESATDGPTTSDSDSTTDGTDSEGTTDGPTTGTTTGGVECVDPGPEPNDDPEDSVELDNLGCNDGAETFTGVLDGADDVDWHTYVGQWGQGCGFGDPDTITTVTASDDVRICVYADCFQGQTNLDCPNNSDEDTVQGVDGCCATGEVELTVDCFFTANKSSQVWIRLDEAPADACVEYSVDYVYND